LLTKFFLFQLSFRILDVSIVNLQNNFDKQASDSVKNPRNYARNFLEYCCFMALAQISQVAGYLADKNFRRLSFDMMLAWDGPSSSSQHSVKVLLGSVIELVKTTCPITTRKFYVTARLMGPSTILNFIPLFCRLR
jgi:hypothetical protein